MPRPKRGWNSHQLKLRAFPFFARLRREDPFKSADDAAWKTEADRISGGSEQWYSHAGWKEDHGFKLIGFATQDQADAMQRWILESGIETRPVPPKYNGPQLSVAGVEPA